MKKRFLLFIILFALGKTSQAQQDISFSMYNFNPLFANPATAGYQDKQWLSALGRYQWVGIEGAPKSAVVSFQTPLKNENIAIGALFKYDAIGLMKNMGLDISFAYRIRLDDKTRLSLGLMGSMFHYNDQRRDAQGVALNDPTLSNVTAWIPNFGAGAYLYSNRYFLGASAPHLLNLRIADPQAAVVGSTLSRIYNHYFASAGYVFGKEDGVKFKPTTFVKFSENSSLNIDINGNILLQDRFWFGLGYRSGGDVISEAGEFKQLNGLRGESVIATFKMMATNFLEVGYSYDYPLSRLNVNTSGSHEIYVGMELGKRTGSMRYVSPRYVNYF
jgi:type IX secretion system PorP/SprF family membrane protein